MTKKVMIHDRVDILILRSFDLSDTNILKKQTIVKAVKLSEDIAERTIEKRIELMADERKDKKYLIRISNGTYKRNPDLEFEYINGAIDGINGSVKNQNPNTREHTSDLKDAIRACIDNLPHPSSDYPTKAENQYAAKITACESHLLFTDLIHHLAILDNEAISEWEEYKRGLMDLDVLKDNLFSSLRSNMLRCFEGLSLRFVPNDEEYLREYECSLNPISLYNIVIDVQSGEEGYHGYREFHSWLQNNAPVVEKGDHVLWGEVITYMKIPIGDRGLLEAGIPRFMEFFESLEDQEFIDMGKAIMGKVESLKQQKELIHRELQRTLLYASFPGDCEYLK
jgi:hypothetical protein